VITHPEHARILLVKQPQLAYALFQALLLNKIVDSAILERMLATSRAPGGPSLAGPPPAQAQISSTAARPPPHLQQQQPPSHYPPHMPPFPPTGLQHPPTSAMFPPQQHLSHQSPPAMPPLSAQMYRPPQPSAQSQPTPAVTQPSNSMFSQPKQPAAIPEISETQRVCRLFHFAFFLLIY
jgi:cleavage stimulation factor subunit 2